MIILDHNMSDMTAASKVLRAYELVEHILIFISKPSDVRSVRLVSTFCHAVVAKNSRLERRWKRRNGDSLHLALIGAMGVGRGSLVQAWCHNTRDFFDPSCHELWSKIFRIDGNSWRVNFWDQGCLNHYFGNPARDYALSTAYMLVYSLDSPASFEAIVEWQRRLGIPTDPIHEQIQREFTQSTPGAM